LSADLAEDVQRMFCGFHNNADRNARLRVPVEFIVSQMRGVDAFAARGCGESELVQFETWAQPLVAKWSEPHIKSWR
jgi:hypothetical protein